MANDTTKDGILTVSATEQSGNYSGERVGRIWVRDNRVKGASSWKFYGLKSVQRAARLEKIAPSLTAEEFDEKLVDTLAS